MWALVLKHECNLITTAGEEALRETALRPKFGTFFINESFPLKKYSLDQLSVWTR